MKLTCSIVWVSSVRLFKYIDGRFLLRSLSTNEGIMCYMNWSSLLTAFNDLPVYSLYSHIPPTKCCVILEIFSSSIWVWLTILFLFRISFNRYTRQNFCTHSQNIPHLLKEQLYVAGFQVFPRLEYHSYLYLNQQCGTSCCHRKLPDLSARRLWLVFVENRKIHLGSCVLLLSSLSNAEKTILLLWYGRKYPSDNTYPRPISHGFWGYSMGENKFLTCQNVGGLSQAHWFYP